jgi:hypothetical protein
MYGMLPKKLYNTKLETISTDACRKFIGVFHHKHSKQIQQET